MPFQNNNGIRYFTFETLSDCGVTQAVFTRRGGVSPAPWTALNVGATVGDELACVAENKRRSFNALDRPLESLYDVWQVHGEEVVCVDEPRQSEMPHRKADAILTNRSQVTLFMRFADCVPIFLVDPVRQVVGIAHAGWQGTVKRIAATSVQAMVEHYGSRPQDIRAGIGPSIAAHHYEVGPEVVAQVQAVFGPQASDLLPASRGAVQFDLWAANALVLKSAGVHQIELAGICTACHGEDWYSHRAEKGKTGRFGALLALDHEFHS